MKRILIVEDDGALGQGIALALDNPEMETVLCQTLQQGRQAWDTAVFDLAILDVNLPDGSGLDLLRHIRQTGAAPVILLTANDLETDVVTGLELGADDYIVKPFSLAILRARVRARLRGGQTPPVEIGPFVFDFARMEYRKNGRAVELSRTEQKLLRLLVSNRAPPSAGASWSTGSGPTGLRTWTKMPCRSPSSACGTSWRTPPRARSISRRCTAWAIPGRCGDDGGAVIRRAVPVRAGAAVGPAAGKAHAAPAG